MNDWNAYASVEIDENTSEILDNSLRSSFQEAADYVKSKSGSVDVYFKTGALDRKKCKEFLEKATGSSCEDCTWVWRKVERLNREANWDFKYDESDYSSFLSAQMFLETCAKESLSIEFDS